MPIITVGELHKLLKSYPQNLPVYFHTEGQYIPFNSPVSRISKEEFVKNDEAFLCIYADRLGE